MATLTPITFDYDNIATTTLQLIRPRLADTIFKASTVASWLLERGRVKTESGGKWIEEPLIYQKNTNTQAYRGYDVLNVAPTEELTMARYNWRQAATAVSISGLEELENAGPQAVFNLLKQKFMVAEMSFQEWFNEKLTARSSTKDLARDFLGLEEIIEPAATGGSQGSLGGIDKSGTGNEFWENQYTLLDLDTVTTKTFVARNLTKAMITMYNDVTKNHNMQPDLILTTQLAIELYEKENHDLLRLNTVKDTNRLDPGFVGFYFKNALMRWDEDVYGLTGASEDDHRMFFINSRFMGITLHSQRNFAVTPMVKPHNQDARVGQILLAGNMTANNCRFLGVLEIDGIDAIL